MKSKLDLVRWLHQTAAVALETAEQLPARGTHLAEGPNARAGTSGFESPQKLPAKEWKLRIWRCHVEARRAQGRRGAAIGGIGGMQRGKVYARQIVMVEWEVSCHGVRVLAGPCGVAYTAGHSLLPILVG